MWYLTSETDQRTLYVEPGKDITIGRSVDAQVCNFAIPDDPSISRKHATLSVSDNYLYVQDQGSRYGTFINTFDEKLDGSKRQLKSEDLVRFGKMSSVWRVHEVKFVTCTSTLKGENLQILKVCLERLKGVFKNEWDDCCQYLTMPAITLTIKVVLALAQGSHIVSTEFWNKCVEAVNKQAILPDPRLYTPEVVEATLNKECVSFHPLEERKNLFAGQIIIFFSRRQLDMYKTALVKCSAIPLLLSESKMTKVNLCESKVIVIQYNTSNAGAETQAQKNQINEIAAYLKNKGRRLVADAEIGLAILYCSITKYCNPEFNFPAEVVRQDPPNRPPANVLAPESQDPSQNVQHNNVVINESLSTSKRKLSDTEENGDTEYNASKRQATEPFNSSNESVKRKHDGSGDATNASKKMAVENDENGLFDFLNNSTEENNFQEKKLNFKKPVNKTAGANEEEDLFNFVQDESKARDDSKNNIFDANIEIKKEPTEHKEVDINALRGANLKDLDANKNAFDVKKVKKEDEDLDSKMNDLDLGTTILTIKKELIIKKEPIEIAPQDYSRVNFKKFKKVWPLHMHMTVVPRSTIIIEIPDDDETPAAACGTTPDDTQTSITESKDPEQPTDILKELADQHGITEAVETVAMDTDGVSNVTSHEPIDEFISQAY